MTKYKNKGFTLVELLAVVVILVIIMTITIVTVNKQMDKASRNTFIADVNAFIKGAQQKYSNDKSLNAIGEDLFHNTVDDKVCYSIDQQLTGKYVEKVGSKYTGSVEICYGESCTYSYKIWATDGEHFIDGETTVNNKNQIKKAYTTNYPLTCGVEALGGGGTGGDLTTAEFEHQPKEYVMTIVKDGVYALEAWGAQGGDYDEFRGGYGGYSYTEIELHVGDKLYINVGSKGTTTEAGYNNAGAPSGGNNPVGGGGATSITTKSGLLSPDVLPDYVLLVAGGGGGVTRATCCCQGFLATPGSGGGACSESTTSGRVCQSDGAYGKARVAGAGGGYRAVSGIDCNNRGIGGSGYIGNPLTKNGVMYGYNVEDNNGTYTKTISTRNISEAPRAGYAKMGNGFAKVTYIGTFTQTE